MKMCSLNFWWPFNFCKTQVQTKTSRVITQASGKQCLQRLLAGAEIFKMGSQWRSRIKFDARSQPWVTKSGASSIPPAAAKLVLNTSVEMVVSTYLPRGLAKGIICGVTSLRVPSLAGQRAVEPAQSITIRHCCSFLAGGRVFGTVRLCNEWAKKGESGIASIATVFAYYSLV